MCRPSQECLGRNPAARPAVAAGELTLHRVSRSSWLMALLGRAVGHVGAGQASLMSKSPRL